MCRPSGRYLVCFALLRWIGQLAGHDQEENDLERPLRAYRTFSRLRQSVQDRRRLTEREGKRDLKVLCVAEGEDCKPPFKLCCGNLECFWPGGWSMIENGICVQCLAENKTCQRDKQCCQDMHCEKDSSFDIDGTCMRPWPPVIGEVPSQYRCVGMGQKCRHDSQCCQDEEHHLQCNKTHPLYLDGTCEKFRWEGGCYRDGQCVNDCKKPGYQIYGTCV